MLENPWRRFALVVLLAGLGTLFLIVNGLRLGLDLQGGTRLVYLVDIPYAKEKGYIDPDANEQELMAEMQSIIGRRIDPQGVLDASLTQAGEDRILIELPGGDEADAAAIQARIEDLGALEMRMAAYDDYGGETSDGRPIDFSFEIDKEKQRLNDWLQKEENKVAVDKDPIEAIERFNQLAPDKGGPLNRAHAQWFAMYREETGKNEQGKPIWRYNTHELAYPDGQDPSKPSFMLVNMHEAGFTGEDLDARGIQATQDPNSGQPAVGYRIKPGKATLYGDQSEKYIKKCHAIILNKVVRIAPAFESRIDGSGMIRGGFTQDEVGNLVIVLKTGSLKIVPELESKVTLGPTLGAEAIQKGTWSMLTGMSLIIGFMLIYYRFAGVVALIALTVNVALIFGGLAFMRATLTLPGLGGIVLTIGMAVDANILIFERIREEKERGKDLLRSIESGFEKAMSTILDANITTFLTGLILYNVGVGPIRGFAVTLMLGIVSSVFAAVFVGKLMFHALLATKRISKLEMLRLFATPNVRFLKARYIAATVSVILVATGLAIFFQADGQTKYGLDFMGGGSFRVTLRKPLTQQDLRDVIAVDPQFKEAQVTTAGDTIDGRARSFLIKLKLNAAKRAEYEALQQQARTDEVTFAPPYIEKIRTLLGDRLAFEPVSGIRSTTLPDEGHSVVDGVLHSATPVSVAEVRSQLAKKWPNITTLAGVGSDGKPDASLKEATDIYFDMQMEAYPDTPADKKKFEEKVPLDLRQQLRGFKDTTGEPITLSSPFPESSLIGSRAVGDLRDAAIGSIVLSLLIIVMYIRLRFHEYKYGIAACIALVHDVCITLGAVTLFNAIGLVHAEIDLPMIAAFLTIIGYSLNDTIVIFDRVRENLDLQKKLGTKETFEELVDGSVNQTLSRTVLTSLTTFLVVAALFIYNYGAGSVLEGFAFAMMVGIITGTYSTIWIANPIIVWFTKHEKKPGAGGARSAPVAKRDAEEEVEPQTA